MSGNGNSKIGNQFNPSWWPPRTPEPGDPDVVDEQAVKGQNPPYSKEEAIKMIQGSNLDSSTKRILIGLHGLWRMWVKGPEAGDPDVVDE